MAVIEVKNLTKKFIYHEKGEGLRGSLKAIFQRKKLTKEAVKDISFSINRGEFVGFIGPNGAGKTTTLKMLSGILTPSAGQISVLGFDPADRLDEYKKKIAIVMGQKTQLWSTLPAIESFNLMQKIYEIPDKLYRRRLAELAKMLEVDKMLKVQVRKLSLGQRMKCELIGSLLHEPKILFLDEPTIGLDILSQKTIRDFLIAHNRGKKTTILLTSHYMADIKNLCSRVIIINEGKLVFDGALAEIIARYSDNKIVSLKFEEKVNKGELSRFGKVLKFIPYEAEISIPVELFRQNISELLARFPIRDLNIQDVALEEIIGRVFNGK